MVNQILINAGDRIGFQQNMERLSFEETAFSIYIQIVKLIFGEEPLRTPRNNRFVGNLPCRRIWEDIKVESARYEKLMNNSLIFSEENFEFKKINQTNMETYTRLLNLPRIRFYI